MNKKLLFAIPDLGSGGAERVISILSQEFATQGYDVEVLMFFGERIHYQIPESVKISRLDLLKYPMTGRIRQLRAMLHSLRRQYDGVTVFALQDSVLKYVLAARFGLRGIQVISAERNNPYIKGKSLFSRVKNSLPYLLSDHTVFQTPSARSYYFVLPKRKCSVIPNPINPSGFRWSYDSITKHKLVSVCRLHEQKNLPMTLSVMNELRQKYPDIHLDIYGEGHLRDMIESKIKELDLEEVISLKGTTRQVTKILSESSLFISTSDFEGISNSMLEAMSVGMPIVCTDCPIGGAHMMLNDGAGLLSPVGNVGEFVSRVSECIDKPELSAKIADNALKKSQQFSPEKIAQKWLELAIK